MDKPVGIDLGTTYSVVAVMRDHGEVEVLRNREGETTTPSVVLFDPDEPRPLVGAEAKDLGGAMPDRIVEMVKRNMGRQIEWEFDGRIYAPAEISAMILAKLKADAEHRLGEPVRDAVVTVPAYFANDEREATRRAAELAGLNLLQIINEPTAAAIAYRLGKSPSAQTILVYDLGGGTFDVTLMEVTPAGIDVLSTEGEVELGGKDWDELLVNHVAEAFRAEHGIDPCDDTDAYQSLMAAAESAKRSLTERNKVTIPCRVGGQKSMVSVPRESFEEMAGGAGGADAVDGRHGAGADEQDAAADSASPSGRRVDADADDPRDAERDVPRPGGRDDQSGRVRGGGRGDAGGETDHGGALAGVSGGPVGVGEEPVGREHP